MSFLIVTQRHPDASPHDLGLIPFMLDSDDPRSAKEQFDEGYNHGGGWKAFPGFTMDDNERLTYPGDPSMEPLAEIGFRNEKIIVYPYAWVVIKQKDGSWECCRMD